MIIVELFKYMRLLQISVIFWGNNKCNHLFRPILHTCVRLSKCRKANSKVSYKFPCHVVFRTRLHPIPLIFYTTTRHKFSLEQRLKFLLLVCLTNKQLNKFIIYSSKNNGNVQNKKLRQLSEFMLF